MATETIAVAGPLARAPGRPHLSRVLGTRDRIELADVYIDQLDLAGAVARIEEFLAGQRTHQIVTVNLDFLSIAHRDAAFRGIINDADLAVADGMPLVWVSRIKGQPLPRRITGVELVHESCLIAARDRRSLFLLGAAPGIADTAAERLQERYPGLRIAGTFSPPYRPLSSREDADLVNTINAARPDILLVALGAPRQDHWIHQHRDRIDVPVAIGVGCVLDLYAGAVTRAPHWMQQTGLEWTFRLVQEPGRLWRRYILDDIPMLARLLVTSPRSERVAAASIPRRAEGQAP